MRVYSPGLAVSVTLTDCSGKGCEVVSGGEEAILIDGKSIYVLEMYIRVMGTGELAQTFCMPSFSSTKEYSISTGKCD